MFHHELYTKHTKVTNSCNFALSCLVVMLPDGRNWSADPEEWFWLHRYFAIDPVFCRTPADQHGYIWSHCHVHPNIAWAVLKTPCDHHVIGGCRSRQIFGGVMDFCPNFPKLGRKVFLLLLPTYFAQERSWRPFLDVTSKKMFSCVFLQTLGAIFYSQTMLSVIFAWNFRVLPRCSGICPHFWQIKTFEDVLSPPPLTPVHQHGWWNMKCFICPFLCMAKIFWFARIWAWIMECECFFSGMR